MPSAYKAAALPDELDRQNGCSGWIRTSDLRRYERPELPLLYAAMLSAANMLRITSLGSAYCFAMLAVWPARL